MNRYYLFLILCFLNLLVAESLKYFLDLNSLLYSSLTEQLSIEKARDFFEKARKWQLWGYVLIPFFLFIKTNLIAIVLNIGTFLFNKKIPYKKLWLISIKAEFIFLLVIILKIVYFKLFQTDYSFESVQLFYPLSLVNIIDISTIDIWFLYPLQLINIFELLYLVTLIFLINKSLENTIEKSDGIKIVLSSYIPALIIWIVMIMFLTLNLT